MPKGNEIPKGTVYFIDVRKPGRPVANNTIIVSQTVAQYAPDGARVVGEKTVMMGSDGEGIYTILDTDPSHDAKITKLLSKMARENTGKYPVILGPFSDRVEAFKAMHAKREKSAAEDVTLLKTENTGIKAELEAKDEELEALRAKIAASQKKN